MADLTFKINADAGGFLGTIKKATTTIKDFGIIGGPAVLAVKTAMAGVATASRLAESAVKGVGAAASGVAAGGKSMVGLLNQVNGAVELLNKVLPALTFPLKMAKNAEGTLKAFEGMKTAWGELAGAMGEGVNDAIRPILVSAGVGLKDLKEQARAVGAGIGEAIDLSRAAIQLGSFGDILWVGLKKVTLQWGANLLEFFTGFSFQLQRFFDNTISGAIAAGYDMIGADSKAAKTRESSDSRQASSRRYEAEAVAGMKDFLSPVYDKVQELNDEMSALLVPVRKQADHNKSIEKSTGEAAKGAAGIAEGFNKIIGQVNDTVFKKKDKDKEEKEPAAKAGKPNKDDWQGPIQGYSDEQTKQAAEELGLAPKSKESGVAAPAEKQRTPGRIKGAGFGKKDGPRVGLGYFNGQGMAGVSTPRLDAMKLAKGTTNKTGGASADKAKGEAAQRDAKGLAAADAVAKGLPQIAADMAAVKGHLSKIQSR